MLFTPAISVNYRSPIRIALCCSLVASILSLLALDFGEAARATAGGLIVFWTCVFIAIAQRPQTPARIDVLLIRWASIPVIVGFNVIMQFIWHWRT